MLYIGLKDWDFNLKCDIEFIYIVCPHPLICKDLSYVYPSHNKVSTCGICTTLSIFICAEDKLYKGHGE